MKRKTFYIVYFLFFIWSVKGQNISVNTFPLTDELPSNSIQRILQDKEGFLWLGTLDGLCRYDAYRLLVFRSDVNNPHLLTNNEITCLAEDKNDNLLVGTKSGLNILNKKTYYISVFGDSLLHNKEIKSVKVTRNGYIWVGTTNGTFCFNSDFSLKKHYNTLPMTSVNSFYEDEKGNLWVMLWRNGLYKYDVKNDDFIRMPHVGERDNAFCMHVDRRGNYWLCSWDDGVFLFNPDSNSESIYKPVIIINKEKQSPETVFYSIAEDDANGYIWLMSNSGLYAFRYVDDRSLQEVDVSGLFDRYNNIYSEIIKDREGNLWIAAFNEGLLSIDFEKPHIENFAFPSIKEQTGFATNVTSLHVDEDGDIWFRQNRWGLALYSNNQNKVTLYQDIPILQNQEDFNTAYCIYGFRSMPGVIWVSIENQDIIYEIKKEKGKIISSVSFHLETHCLNAGVPLFFYEDRKNNIWIAASGGLFIKTYNQSEIKPVSYLLGTITGIAEDTRGHIWVSTRNSGVFSFPPFTSLPLNESKTEHFTKEDCNLSSNHIEAICADINGKVWLGTKEGSLFVYDIVAKKFHDQTKLPVFLTEGIHTLVADDFGHIWILTDKRVIKYNPENGASRSYTAKDGVLVSSFKEKSFYKDYQSGKLYFGGNMGISVFNTFEPLEQQQNEIKTIITNVKINNQSVFQANKNGKFDITTQKLRLEPDDKNIEIDFSSLNYSFSPNIRYAYKMEGIDEDWIYTNTNRQYAFYNKLKKGNRTLHIKATDENNLWSPVISSLSIYKRPAFYESWWAYMCYFICFVISVYLFYRWINNRIKLKNELRIAQIEKEKSEELTQTKLRYFTNITHDFLTPLTILSCLIDDAEITHKDKINMFDAMRSNINKLMRLLQQILDFRKIENEKMELMLSQGDIVKFVKDLCYTNFLPLIKRKNISFDFSSSSNQLPACFDADKIDKIIYNLLSNAFKYTSDGGNIGVEIEEFEREHTWLRIKVTDSGIGIDPENLPHIFTRFYNSHKNIAKETNGIGLSLAKELTELHKGHISVQSEQGKGSIFTIEIPIDKDFYKNPETKNLLPLTSGDNTTDSLSDPNSGYDDDILTEEQDEQSNKEDPITLLVVEDNEELLFLIRNVLSHHYQVLTAQNGLEALSVIKENDIDIIISDVMMPEMDGLELCRVLKKELETSHIPVILLTAKNSVDDRVECYNAGADGYISKPFDLKVLDARIKNFIANKKSKQKAFQEDRVLNLSKLEYQTIDEKFLEKAIRVIEANLSDIDFDVDAFANAFSMSKSSLYRKLKTITGLSPVEFIRNIRLKEACLRLKDKSITISEVAYSVGFSEPKYFAKCFKNAFNISPSEYQKKS